ncbi:MAG: SpaA isopeptide-forming pilin-related protein [Eubacteriales bacterium]|nr:SpaA isopeptide-forming pilin-related protein [Eubacteriales bacterium]
MENYGCPSTQMRAMQHYLVDYLYDGESGFGGALSTTAKNMLRAIKEALKEMPDPSAMELLPGLSTTANGLQTETFTWKANEAWVITIALEDGVSLVNETTGTTKNGNVQVKGGEKFHLVASQAKSGNLDGHYKITSNLPLNFHGMLLKLANSQDIGFGYYTDDIDISIVVDWPHSSTVTVEKHDANTGTITATSGYAMNGAVYGIYSDAGCSSLMERLTISNGRATSSTGTYVIGSTYYVKEITAPKGYALDTKVYPITVKSDAGANVAVSTDSPKKGKIRIIKKDAVTNTTSTVNSTYSMVGAEYTVYSNSGCTSAIETIRIGNDNMGVSAKTYLVGTYYVKETKAPDSNLYKLDTNVYPVSISLDQAAAEVTVDVTSTESPKKCKIKIEKHDTETGTTAIVNSAYSMAGAEYTIYSDSSCKSAIETIRVGTDHTATSAKEYLAGTYYVKETKEPTCGLYKIDPTVYTISVTAEKVQAEQIIVATSPEAPKRSKIRIEKHDSDTGTTTPVSAAYSMVGAEYTIYSDAACTRVLETLRIGSDNTATTVKEYLIGDYYIKETKAPLCGLYEMDDKVYTAHVTTDSVKGTAPVQIISTDPVKYGKISVQKINEKDGGKNPYTKALPFKDAVFGIYSAASCSEDVLLQTITTDENGYAESTDLLVDDYWVKEITPAVGYNINTDIIKVNASEMAAEIVHADSNCNYEVLEMVIRGDVSLMKYLADGSEDEQRHYMDMVNSGELAGITFTFHYTAADDVEDVVITTDESGMCGTSGGALIYGEWEIIESNTPEGYEGLKEGTTIFIQKQNEKLNYVVYNGMITAQVRVLKKDAETGNMIPLSGAQFQLYDEKDNLISMYDTVTDTVTDVLTTNSNGIIYFTSKLSYGSYTLKEIYAPEGYTIAEPFTFKVNSFFQQRSTDDSCGSSCTE